MEEVCELYLKDRKRHVFAAAINYLQLINLFKDIVKNKRQQFDRKLVRISNGLERLEQARLQVKYSNIIFLRREILLEKTL